MEFNLLEQTLESLELYRKDTKDIDWVGSRCGKYCLSWEQFKGLSSKVVCKPLEVSGEECAHDLVIVFKCGDWLARFDECGQNGWEYMTIPKKGVSSKIPEHISGAYSPSLDVLNIGREEYLLGLEEFYNNLQEE